MVWVPVAITLIGLALLLVWMPRLPDEIATHWNGAGTADRFASPWWGVVLLAGAVGAFTALMGAAVLRAHGRGVAPAATRLTAAVIPAFAMLMTAIVVGSVAIQVDAGDPADATGIGWVVLGGFTAAALVGVVAWWVLPSRRAQAVPVADAEVLPLRPGQRVAWTATVSASPVVGWIVVGAAVLVLLPTLSMPGMWWVSALALLLVGVLSLTLFARVSVDERGLRVRGVLGVPLMTVRIDDIAGAAAVTVDPIAEFGGWGWRIDATGRRGFVLRRGPAIEVRRRDGRTGVVTVPDAAVGASALQTLVASRGTG